MRPIFTTLNPRTLSLFTKSSSATPKTSPHLRSPGRRMKPWRKSGPYPMNSFSAIDDSAPFAQLETSAIRQSLNTTSEGDVPFPHPREAPVRGIHVTNRIDQKIDMVDKSAMV